MNIVSFQQMYIILVTYQSVSHFYELLLFLSKNISTKRIKNTVLLT